MRGRVILGTVIAWALLAVAAIAAADNRDPGVEDDVPATDNVLDRSESGPDGDEDSDGLPPFLTGEKPLPPGLADRDELPPGLAKKLDGNVPPGQAKKSGDWVPPGQAKKSGDWVPPGQAKKLESGVGSVY